LGRNFSQFFKAIILCNCVSCVFFKKNLLNSYISTIMYDMIEYWKKNHVCLDKVALKFLKYDSLQDQCLQQGLFKRNSETILYKGDAYKKECTSCGSRWDCGAHRRASIQMGSDGCCCLRRLVTSTETRHCVFVCVRERIVERFRVCMWDGKNIRQKSQSYFKRSFLLEVCLRCGEVKLKMDNFIILL
jgi:hypothetical protein